MRAEHIVLVVAAQDILVDEHESLGIGGRFERVSLIQGCCWGMVLL